MADAAGEARGSRRSPLIARWVDNGWPLVKRRVAPDDGEGVPLGLPLPPFAGKGRLSVLIDPG